MKFDLASGFGKLHSQKENPRPHFKKKKIYGYHTFNK